MPCWPDALRPAFAVPLAFAALGAGAALGACDGGTTQRAADAERGALAVGGGAHTYTWLADWPRLGGGRTLGSLHGQLAFDAAGRLYATSDEADAVLVFEPDGTLVDAWGAELANGLHGIALESDASGAEYLLLAHFVQGTVTKTTLAGEILWQVGCPLESGLYERADQYHPTGVAIAPDGAFWVADGYGLSYVHRYDPDGGYVASFGGRGARRGELRNPHGLWFDAERGELWVADRENRRLQVFDRDGEPRFVLDQRATGHDLGRPCFVEVRGRELLMADIEGRVLVLDRRGGLIAELGPNRDPDGRDRNDVPRSAQRSGTFVSPHCARWDSSGDIYVSEWLLEGRLTKLVRH